MHHSSRAADKTSVWCVSEDVLCFAQKHLCGGDCDMRSTKKDSEWGTRSATTACHGWSNRGEECEHVNDHNAELCFSLVRLLLFSVECPVTITKSTCVSCLWADLDLFLCTGLVFTIIPVKRKCFGANYIVSCDIMPIAQKFKNWREMCTVIQSVSNYNTTN